MTNVNRLVGEHTNLSKGAMPDPSQGVALRCRFFDGETWGGEISFAPEMRAAWLQNVTLEKGQFRVTSYIDDGTLIGTPKQGDGTYIASFDGTAFSALELVHAAGDGVD